MESCRSPASGEVLGDEAVKGAVSTEEMPAEVTAASGTQVILPGVAFEPGELRGWFPLDKAAEGLFEAANLVDDSGRVEKCVVMGTIHGDRFLFGSDRQ